ncbi:hypothetical protein MMC17_003543 [Xylographa soralifera]|nr:hypothetical protein [Xylographa soralifera]
MVSLTDVQASNSSIASSLPAGLVAVFVGATSGIGEYTLLQFAKHARQPRVYFVGRSQEAGDRIAAKCKSLNADGQYTFSKADTSLLSNVDAVCRAIKSKETAVNLLFLTTGTLKLGASMPTHLPSPPSPHRTFPSPKSHTHPANRLPLTETAENLHYSAALVTYSRTRFITNLLPLLQRAPSLRRVVSVLCAGKEGPVDASDLQGWHMTNMLAQRGHGASQVTMALEALAAKAPDVSFIHNFPGSVRTNLIRGGEGKLIAAMAFVSKIVGAFVDLHVPPEECGARHVFLATSAKYPAGKGGEETAGVPLPEGVAVARGVDGQSGSGVYSIDQDGESTGPKVEELLAGFRREGLVDKVWQDTQEQFQRITGQEAI